MVDQHPGRVPSSPFGGLDPEEFRTHGREVVDWIADYLASVERYPVVSRDRPGDVRKRLAGSPPAQPQAADRILADFNEHILPGITHWNHPGFFAYFAISGSAPGILGEMISAALNVNAMLWRTSPAATELEASVTDWLRQMLGLPTRFEGLIADTASMSTMLALAAAREQIGADVRRRGLAGRDDLPALRLYCSEQVHSSVEKAAIALGIGLDGVVKVRVDSVYRMSAESLAAAIEEDRSAGRLPFAVVATVGTTSTTSVDPVDRIAEVCEHEGLWLHVDGAYGGIAAIVPELRQVLTGCDRADSIVVNPHKWLMTPIDCSVLFVRDLERLAAAFSLTPEYLRTREGDAGEVHNYMDYGVQLGRRFRALKLWFVIRSYGTEGLASHIRYHCRLAQRFAEWIREAPEFELLAPVPFSTVCFRHRPVSTTDEAELARHNEGLLAEVNRTGEVFLSHTVLDGRYCLRLAVGNQATRERHVARAWELLREAAARLGGQTGIASR